MNVLDKHNKVYNIRLIMIKDILIAYYTRANIFSYRKKRKKFSSLISVKLKQSIILNFFLYTN